MPDRNRIFILSTFAVATLLVGCSTQPAKNGQPNTHEAVHPMLIQQGSTIGLLHFSDGDTSRGGHGQTVDGIHASRMEKVDYHIHAHLSLFDKGQQIAVPRGIGITPPRSVQDGFVVSGKQFYWLHTHDATGIIHIESPIQKEFTLGDFFDIWGQPLNQHNVAGFQGKLHIFIDGHAYKGNPSNMILIAHEQITLEIGSPIVTPPKYTFPKGL